MKDEGLVIPCGVHFVMYSGCKDLFSGRALLGFGCSCRVVLGGKEYESSLNTCGPMLGDPS